MYNLFKNCVLELFESIDDFLYLLNENDCYSFLLKDNNLKIINKISLISLKEEINISDYKSLNIYNIKDDIIKYIIIEKDIDDNIIKKIHINIEDIKGNIAVMQIWIKKWICSYLKISLIDNLINKI